MGTYNVPRNVKGEGRILFIFSAKALVYTAIGGACGLPFYLIFRMFSMNLVGIIIMAILGLIGLAARARKISFGADSVELQAQKKKVYLIILAQNSSVRTKEKFQKISEKYKIPIIITETIENLSKAIGKNNKAILGIEDINLASEIQKINNGGEAIG